LKNNYGPGSGFENFRTGVESVSENVNLASDGKRGKISYESPDGQQNTNHTVVLARSVRYQLDTS